MSRTSTQITSPQIILHGLHLSEYGYTLFYVDTLNILFYVDTTLSDDVYQPQTETVTLMTAALWLNVLIVHSHDVIITLCWVKWLKIINKLMTS